MNLGLVVLPVKLKPKQNRERGSFVGPGRAPVNRLVLLCALCLELKADCLTDESCVSSSLRAALSFTDNLDHRKILSAWGGASYLPLNVTRIQGGSGWLEG